MYISIQAEADILNKNNKLLSKVSEVLSAVTDIC